MRYHRWRDNAGNFEAYLAITKKGNFLFVPPAKFQGFKRGNDKLLFSIWPPREANVTQNGIFASLYSINPSKIFDLANLVTLKTPTYRTIVDFYRMMASSSYHKNWIERLDLQLLAVDFDATSGEIVSHGIQLGREHFSMTRREIPAFRSKVFKNLFGASFGSLNSFIGLLRKIRWTEKFTEQQKQTIVKAVNVIPRDVRICCNREPSVAASILFLCHKIPEAAKFLRSLNDSSLRRITSMFRTQYILTLKKKRPHLVKTWRGILSLSLPEYNAMSTLSGKFPFLKGRQVRCKRVKDAEQNSQSLEQERSTTPLVGESPL